MGSGHITSFVSLNEWTWEEEFYDIDPPTE